MWIVAVVTSIVIALLLYGLKNAKRPFSV